MSPSLPPEGEAVLTVLLPYPLLLEAILRVRLAANDPPPLSPEPAEILRLVGTPPSADKALAAELEPVPPEEIGKAEIPEMLPPVMLTLLEF